ncbi:MAG: SAM-dependent methyltransferase [Hyphomicrobiales bacterium]
MRWRHWSSNCSTGADCSDGATRIGIDVAPGISALQGAAARAGAPLGHDFCTISLSDLLTPWEDIQRRVRAAGEGDFVVAFYNPVSKKRRTSACLGARRTAASSAGGYAGHPGDQSGAPRRSRAHGAARRIRRWTMWTC